MSVAENPTTEQSPRSVQQQAAIGSVIGAFALLAGLWFVLAGMPELWSLIWNSLWETTDELKKNPFLRDALLILLDLGVVAGLTFAAYTALQKQSLPGLRAGIVFAAAYIFCAAWLVIWIGSMMEHQFDDNPAVGIALMLVVFAALVGAAGYVYVAVPGWQRFLEVVEHQGWFHAFAYKGNQGVRVRRGTIIGVLAVGVSGIITMVMHRFFGAERPHPTLAGVMLSNDWVWDLPFTDPQQYFPLVFKIHLMLPIVLGVLLLWFAWRVVNVPAFADFLIATEAEMNKVSWTNRRRLVTDTIVVLVTVFLFTTFLFVVDVVWIKVLSFPYIQVLLIDPREQAQKQQETAKW